jgi:hypothetical protein
MALKKLLVKNNGITTEYHKIASVKLADRNSDIAMTQENEPIPLHLDIEVVSYLNAEYRQRCQSISTQIYHFIINPEEEMSAIGIRAFSYGKLKTLDIFADAEDC